MVDNFSLLVAHIIIAIALWRLLMNDAVDQDPPEPGSDAGA